MTDNESQPLLRDATSQGFRSRATEGYHGILVEVSYNDPSRRETRRFLSSKWGHYFVLGLVSLDVSCIFADFLISLYVCDHKCDKGESVYVSSEGFIAKTVSVTSEGHLSGAMALMNLISGPVMRSQFHYRKKNANADTSFRSDDFKIAQDVLGVVSLIFTCLFMAELLASIWAFGFSFFISKFHCFDATIIVAGFIIDVCLSGVLEEAGSIVVILRLWRVFKIVEEFSAGASDQMDIMAEKIEKLEAENQGLKKVLSALRQDEDSGQ